LEVFRDIPADAHVRQLKLFLTQRTQRRRQERWVFKISIYSFAISASSWRTLRL